MLKNLKKRLENINFRRRKDKRKIKEMFRKESEKKMKLNDHFGKHYFQLKNFLEAGIKENLIEIRGKDEEEKESNRQLLIERLRSEIYKMRSYKEL